MFEISGADFKQVAISVHGRKIKATKIEKSRYIAEYKPDANEEKIKVIVYGDNCQLGSGDISIVKSGLRQNKKFDI